MSEKILEKIRHRRKAQLLLILSLPLAFYIIYFLIPFIAAVGVSVGLILPREVQLQRGEVITLRYYMDAINPIFLKVLGKSLYIAVATTVLCLVLGYPLAYYVAFKGGRYRNVLILLVIVPFWVTFLLRAYAMLSLLSPEGVLNSFLINTGIISKPLFLIYNENAVLLGMVYGYLPFTVLPLYASLEKISRVYVEAAKVLGASPVRAFLHVTLPLSKPGLVAGTLLTFIPSAGEFIIPEFLGGPNEFFVGNMIYSAFIEAQNWNWGASIATIYIAIVIAGIMLYLKYVGEELRI
ncbi:MAG TPA: ABC transporter permease [Candidatus Caldiarchaeum subterraneum]|uniref:ABC transporter permease n=1 Tax=Caldiarchaeum subterraneum TaxID=311458 RepID=A0A832ZVN0_CALS0|nr:ABC transporter permease [Aigarchaeota archaeon]HIQ29696.1 ABC transporter permease [Candidatus Caldarchaeum subterraneum]